MDTFLQTSETMIRLAGEESKGGDAFGEPWRRVSGFFTGLGGAGALVPF